MIVKVALLLNFMQRKIKELESERNSMVIEEEESLKDYYDLLQQYKSLKKDVHDIILSPKYVLPFLQPGRLVRIQYSTNESSTFSIDENVTWGVIINFEKVKSHGEGTHSILRTHSF
jgi:ATP-dependent RNA helicase DOB1